MSPPGLANPPRCLADKGHSRPKWAVHAMSGLPRLATEPRTLLWGPVRADIVAKVFLG